MNFVHYNAAYLDEEVLVGLVQLTCVLANKAIQLDVIQVCVYARVLQEADVMIYQFCVEVECP